MVSSLNIWQYKVLLWIVSILILVYFSLKSVYFSLICGSFWYISHLFLDCYLGLSISHLFWYSGLSISHLDIMQICTNFDRIIVLLVYLLVYSLVYLHTRLDGVSLFTLVYFGVLWCNAVHMSVYVRLPILFRRL